MTWASGGSLQIAHQVKREQLVWASEKPEPYEMYHHHNQPIYVHSWSKASYNECPVFNSPQNLDAVFCRSSQQYAECVILFTTNLLTSALTPSTKIFIEIFKFTRVNSNCLFWYACKDGFSLFLMFIKGISNFLGSCNI